MELKTKIHAEDGKQELFITRNFDLPVELLFEAFIAAVNPAIPEPIINTSIIILIPKFF